jgi:hypothetical protein
MSKQQIETKLKEDGLDRYKVHYAMNISHNAPYGTIAIYNPEKGSWHNGESISGGLWKETIESFVNEFIVRNKHGK